MKKLLEELWNDYIADVCAVLDTEEEKRLSKIAVEAHRSAIEVLTKEQQEGVEKYVDVLSELQLCFAKKAFFKGCEFSVSFMLETALRDKNRRT